jgi:hypothetical protein
MPYKISRLKGGRLRVKSPSGKRTFRSRKTFKRWKRVAEAVKHGWKKP